MTTPIREVALSFRRLSMLIFSALFLVLPTALLGSWQALNHGPPVSDSGDHFRIATLIYDACTHGPHACFSYAVRTGGKPILFAAFGAPFVPLYAFGHALPSTVFLILAYVALTWAYFGLFRSRIGIFDSTLMTAVILTLPGVFRKHYWFMPEVIWHVWFIFFLKASLRSENFSKPGKTVLAGFFLALAILARPVESIAILAPALAVFVLLQTKSRAQFLTWLGSIAIFAVNAALAAFASEHDWNSRVGILAGIAAITEIWYFTRWRKSKTGQQCIFELLAFPSLFCCIWFGYYFHALYLWAADNSTGAGAQITDHENRAKPLFEIAWTVVQGYGGLQLLALGGVTLAALILIIRSSRRGSTRYWFWVLIAAFSVLPMLFAYKLTGTSELRRIFLGLVFVLALAGFLLGEAIRLRPRMKYIFRLSLMAILAFDAALIADTVFNPSPKLARWTDQWIPSRGEGLPPPQLAAGNENVVIQKVKDLNIHNAKIAVFSLSLFTNTVNYETESLRTATLYVDRSVNYRTSWGITQPEPYHDSITRLVKDDFTYVLLDDFDDPFAGSPNEERLKPHTFFAHDMLAIIRSTGPESLPDLKLVSEFMVGDRKSYLFKIER